MMTDRIRIVQFIVGLDPVAYGGGADSYGMRLALGLDPARFERAVCALWRYSTPVEERWHQRLRESGVEVHFLAQREASAIWRQRVAAMKAFLPYLQRTQPTIVNSHTEPPDLIVMQVRPRCARPPIFVRTAHNEREATARPVWGQILWHLYPLFFDQEVGVSKRVVERLEQRPVARWRRREVLCLPNGIDVDEIQASCDGASIRAELELPPDMFLIGSVGRLEPQKGYGWLLRAFKILVETGAPAHLILVGEGSLRSALQQQIQELGLQAQVSLLGGRADSLSLIRQMDLFVSSSLWEGLPTVVMEAMALGTPVVATAVSGNVELVLPHKTGLLIAPERVEECARAIRYLYERPEERQRIAEAAQQHIRSFSFRRTIQGYEALYDRLIADRGRSALSQSSAP